MISLLGAVLPKGSGMREIPVQLFTYNKLCICFAVLYTLDIMIINIDIAFFFEVTQSATNAIII